MAPPMRILMGGGAMDRSGGRGYGGEVLRRLLSVLGYEPKQQRPPEPESVRLLKVFAEQLNQKATRYRAVAARAVLLEQRISQLETDSATWEQRAENAAQRGIPELTVDVTRICGRIEGQLQETRGELAVMQADEIHLRKLLSDSRHEFAKQLEGARELGHDVSGCLLYIDLTRPECPADEELLADDGRDFVARVIDGPGVH